jgi:preflagellin peptidase FlaK
VLLDALLRSSTADLLRLLAVPAFAWAAYRDIRTRRVPNRLWPPLVALGVLALGLDLAGGLPADPFDRQILLLRVGVSVGLVAPLGYIFYRIGGFGGADAKAVLVLALLFPLYPVYFLPNTSLPLNEATLGVFSLTVFSNTVVVGILYPVALSVRNLLSGKVGLPMVVGMPVAVSSLPTAYGSLLETPDGYTRSGLDVDALRMYLRWRGLTLSELQTDPERYRDPRSLPETFGDPGDGAVADGAPIADGGEPSERSERGDPRRASASESDGGERPEGPRGPVGATGSAGSESSKRSERDDVTPAVTRVDWWGADAFLADIDGTAYGTTPTKLREGLEVVAREDEVWLTPGIPFIVPMFVGLVVALTYGDLLFVLLRAGGLVP